MSQKSCPFFHSQVNKAATANLQWWPESLDLRSLQQYRANDPTSHKFDYKKAFESLDMDALKADLTAMLTTSQPWWPADYGHYGGLMVRLAWHSAGTYRAFDGRGGAGSGNIRMPPLNSWPDNGNLDKARRLLWPIKQKYGNKISWADLIVLAGNQAIENMGLKPFGFGGGRVDVYSPEYDVYWGKETEMLADDRHEADGVTLKCPLGAVVMGLIYVNPEGTPSGEPNVLEAAKHIRETFGNMGMNDFETAALIAGGHTFGKAHGAYADSDLGDGPAGSDLQDQGLGYKNPNGSGIAEHTSTSGLEGAWTQDPTEWDMDFVNNLFRYEWECSRGPGGKWQWKPKDPNADKTPDAHIPNKRNDLMMLTTDLALVHDPEYRKIMLSFRDDPKLFDDAFAKAWYTLTHRDSGPVSRLLGSDVPPEPQLWQDPVPVCDHKLVHVADVESLKDSIMACDVSHSALVKAAWASASTFRRTDFRGGANGARIRFAPQKDWEVNDPTELAKVVVQLEKVQKQFNDSQKDGKRVSMADLVVLGGCAALEHAIKTAGIDGVIAPFTPGRMDATMELTDPSSFMVLEPKSDPFRNYHEPGLSSRSPEEMMVDKASLLGLTAPEMTVLVGGMRVLGANACQDRMCGVLTSRPGTLSNDFFTNLLDMSTEWKQIGSSFEGVDRETRTKKYTASRVDLIFGHNSELRAIAEYYACADMKTFAQDFVAAFNKVMNADRF